MDEQWKQQVSERYLDKNPDSLMQHTHIFSSHTHTHKNQFIFWFEIKKKNSIVGLVTLTHEIIAFISKWFELVSRLNVSKIVSDVDATFTKFFHTQRKRKS